jgi:uncharacterized protein (TIGR02271 family)
MPLHRIKDFDPNYRDHFEGNDLSQFDLYSANDKIGSIEDVLVDDNGKIRYLVVHTGNWIFGKRILMPIGLANIDERNRRIHAGLTREQVQDLPEFKEDMVTDLNYEERVRGVYRPSRSDMAANSQVTPLESSTPLEQGAARERAPMEERTYNTAYPAPTDANVADVEHTASIDRDVQHDYDREPGLFGMNEQNHGRLRLYEERLIANKQRQKTGEVQIGKRVETETAHVSVPIEKERVVIERTPVSGDMAQPVTDANFQEGDVVRMEVYEETPDIRKEAFVREEVSARKVVDQDTVEREEEIRRERLDVNTQGQPVVENPDAPNRI